MQYICVKLQRLDCAPKRDPFPLPLWENGERDRSFALRAGVESGWLMIEGPADREGTAPVSCRVFLGDFDLFLGSRPKRNRGPRQIWRLELFFFGQMAFAKFALATRLTITST